MRWRGAGSVAGLGGVNASVVAMSLVVGFSVHEVARGCGFRRAGCRCGVAANLGPVATAPPAAFGAQNWPSLRCRCQFGPRDHRRASADPRFAAASLATASFVRGTGREFGFARGGVFSCGVYVARSVGICGWVHVVGGERRFVALVFGGGRRARSYRAGAVVGYMWPFAVKVRMRVWLRRRFVFC